MKRSLCRRLKAKLGVSSSTLDPSCMTSTCNQAKNAPHGIAAILVYYTLMTGNKQFAKAEELMYSNYEGENSFNH
jgi:hypothetical protein